MNELICLLGLVICSITDLKCQKIKNIVVMPLALLGLYVTGNWLAVLILFLLGLGTVKLEMWSPGDAKLIIMLAAFLGINAIYIMAISFSLLLAGRKAISRLKYGAIPMAPFILIATIIQMAITRLLPGW